MVINIDFNNTQDKNYKILIDTLETLNFDTKVAIVTNPTVAALHLNHVLSLIKADAVHVISVPDGEAYKNMETIQNILNQCFENRLDRQSILIALGGGVVGDMTGFAAASYQRGVPFIQIPTTLLAQLDSSVGGKTAVNHSLGKNMIGAFYQPQCVIADTLTLNTLDDRQLSSGLAEVIKYGLINDAEFFGWLENNISALRDRDQSALAEAIERSCQDKADLVAQDEREQGVRALLNLGHTFGHAIETGMGYGNFLHGEGVAVGIVMAADLSQRMGWIEQADIERIKDILTTAGLPISVPTGMSSEQFMSLMSVDKKVQDGQIRFVLLKNIGEAVISNNYSAKSLAETLTAFEN